MRSGLPTSNRWASTQLPVFSASAKRPTIGRPEPIRTDRQGPAGRTPRCSTGPRPSHRRAAPTRERTGFATKAKASGSSSGTTSSSSTTGRASCAIPSGPGWATRRRGCHRSRSRAWTPVWGSNDRPRCWAERRACTIPIRSRLSSASSKTLAIGFGMGAIPMPIPRFGSSPTTFARPASASPTASCREMRAAATCSAGSFAAPC